MAAPFFLSEDKQPTCVLVSLSSVLAGGIADWLSILLSILRTNCLLFHLDLLYDKAITDNVSL